ncbi:piggyBac transposable element-derived protein 1 [Octopus bimaculoides]|uniref:PiggyBac transposable element-derived protein domain-containing protein n=1 Tax=Octopus bimaculoides TaxID=37653 RepID=A0A0L8HTT9_OCTBM|nr:piggyBac transposable element-derived protein 1 [Octopus bimaculoides]|eukprot:XP_014769447.1 PREDICTED: piggyBac transposable element-derived protein 1-like [Octopus bimaculoides]
MYAFDVYVGKCNQDIHTELGTGGDVVMKLIQKANVTADAGYRLHFDNYFTSFKLLNHLGSAGICATSTVRENRLLNCPLAKRKTFKKQPKWSSNLTLTSTVCVMKYKDNNVVTIASNFNSPIIGTSQKYSAEVKSYISIPQPTALQNYNLYMGGVDLIDQLVASDCTQMRQKWLWPISIHFIEVVVVNSCTDIYQ